MKWLQTGNSLRTAVGVYHTTISKDDFSTTALVASPYLVAELAAVFVTQIEVVSQPGLCLKNQFSLHGGASDNVPLAAGQSSPVQTAGLITDPFDLKVQAGVRHLCDGRISAG